MKLIETLKTFVAPLTNMLKGWTIRRRGNWRRTWRWNLLPSFEYTCWRTHSGPQGQAPTSKNIEHCLEVSFLTSYYTVSLYKETKIAS